MNQILLAPTDVLFFRDGRPMAGSSTGHGAAWPLPTVTSGALHAALWRSGLATTARTHYRSSAGTRSATRGERFGSLITAGPFPVCTRGSTQTWFLPRPLDADCALKLDASQKQTGEGSVAMLATPTFPSPGSGSSNPLPLVVASNRPPTKAAPEPWWSEGAWNAYLGTPPRDAPAARLFARHDSDFSDTEASVGIGLDGSTGAQDGERLYSAHYLRLRHDWRLGLFAATGDKFDGEELRGEREDLIPKLIEAEGVLLIGGQQRNCTATCEKLSTRHPLPLGMKSGFTATELSCLGDSQIRYLVKWALFSPAIYPRLSTAQPAHPGGWLPSWVHPENYTVQLRTPITRRDLANESRSRYRDRVASQPAISARLVAALVGKPIPVTGWSLGIPDNLDSDYRDAGAKPTYLAVPAGSVYYFACDTAEAATQLATALNWHGDTEGTAIRNRRSALLGEKGFGLGACSTWNLQNTSEQTA